MSSHSSVIYMEPVFQHHVIILGGTLLANNICHRLNHDNT